MNSSALQSTGSDRALFVFTEVRGTGSLGFGNHGSGQAEQPDLNIVLRPVGAASPQTPLNAEFPARCISIPGDRKDGHSPPQIISEPRSNGIHDDGGWFSSFHIRSGCLRYHAPRTAALLIPDGGFVNRCSAVCVSGRHGAGYVPWSPKAVPHTLASAVKSRLS